MRSMESDELARLSRLERQVAYLCQHLGLDPAAADGMHTAPVSGFGVSPEVMAAIQRDKLIDAIKIYRQQTGAGLREAKLAVEGFARGRPR